MKNMFSGKINTALLVIRIIVGVIFMAHGIAKFNMGLDGVTGFFENAGIPAAGLMAWVVTLVETLGGAALIIGVATELAAGLLMVVMIVAILTVKGTMGLVGGYELDLSLIAAMTPLLVLGAGRYALSRYLSMHKRTPISTL